MTHQTTTMLQLREMILSGELIPGERVTEADMAARLGLSRTPVRNALPALALEGLLVRSGQRGFAVREFSADDTLDTLRLRAVLEGYAARLVAERGVSAELHRELNACLAAGDALLSSGHLTLACEAEYGEMNSQLHALILGNSGVSLLASLADRCNVVPFAGSNHLAFSVIGKQSKYKLLQYAHMQHHGIVEAMITGQGDRAEFLFREHAIGQERSMSLRPSNEN